MLSPVLGAAPLQLSKTACNVIVHGQRAVALVTALDSDGGSAHDVHLKVRELRELGRVVLERHVLIVDQADAAAIIGDLNELAAAFLQSNLHRRGPGVQGVLNELLQRVVRLRGPPVAADGAAVSMRWRRLALVLC